MALVCGSMPAYSQALYNKKDAEKEAKKEAKKLSKEKWEYTGVGTLEKALTIYWVSVKEYGGKFEGSSKVINNVSSLRKGEKMLLTDAQTEYAQTNAAYLIGELESATGEKDILVDANVVKYAEQFNGDVRKQFILFKKNHDGTYDMKGYFLIDSEGTQAKLRKLVDTLKQEGDIAEEIKKRVLGNGE